MNSKRKSLGFQVEALKQIQLKYPLYTELVKKG